MGRFIDEAGNRYGRLTVLRRAKNKGVRVTWLCQCDCGNETVVAGCSLRRGLTKGCGCLRGGSEAIDETGNKHGLLTVLRRVENRGRAVMWLCRCECGNESVVSASNLRREHTKSCGCLQQLPEGLASARYCLAIYRRRAGHRRLTWELTEEQFLDLTSKDCFYCDVGPKQRAVGRHCNGVYIYNGIDRQDNAEGYTLKNCVPCCGRCNRAKDVMGLDEFTGWVAQVYHHLNPH